MVNIQVDQQVSYLTGRLSQDEVKQLWPQRKTLIAADCQSLNLSKLTYSDSAGVAFLLELVAVNHLQGGKLVMCDAPAQLTQLIHLYDLHDFFL